MPWVRLKQTASGVLYNQAVTHGDQLTINDVGPWALQAVPKGTETLQTVAVPGRGYWRFDAATEFTSDTAWPSNAHDGNPSVLNNPALHEGIVTGSPVTIDGQTIPVGTYICQFRNFPDPGPFGGAFYAQSASLKILFRGCRWRWNSGVDGVGLFNDSFSTTSQRIMLHYCDIGLNSQNLTSTSGLMHIKFLGGAGHVIKRCYMSNNSTYLQPTNAQGCRIIENYIPNLIYWYGMAGESGVGPDSTVQHLNGLSIEGGMTDLQIVRNKIFAPSPDGSTGGGATAAGQPGYGTQPGQLGYATGSNPGRRVDQTDNIALFAILGSNKAVTPGAILVDSNMLGGAGYCLYAGNADGGAEGIHVTNNKFTTYWWTNGGTNGPVADQPPWGTLGNFQANNTWADDYGTGGDGATAIADRQYPAGNGPRKGTSVI